MEANDDQTLTSCREDIIKFAKLPNVIATPNTAFNTYETKDRFGSELLKNINTVLEENPTNIVS